MTKTQQVVLAYKSGDLKQAFRIIKGFRTLTSYQKMLFSKAYEYLTHPSFYTQLTTQAKMDSLIQDATGSLKGWVKRASNV